MMMRVLSSLLLLSLLTTPTLAIPPDTTSDCQTWADMGECSQNPSYMLVHCATSCHQLEQAQSQDLERIDSFFDLTANDLQGNPVDFAQFRNQVTILTNVASYCGYTESHYQGLVELWSQVVATQKVQILAFPCNQFGQQEPGTADEIEAFSASKGVQFTMMQKVNVNGAQAHPVYKYLKQQAGPNSIAWNFGTYYVVSPDGEVTSYSGVEPMQLKDVVLELLGDSAEL